MPSPARKLNFMIREEIARELGELVPPGRRSKVVNDALAKELLSIKRRTLTGKLLSLREHGPSVTTKDILAALKKDRERR
jgi:hypothetical protein